MINVGKPPPFIPSESHTDFTRNQRACGFAGAGVDWGM